MTKSEKSLKISFIGDNSEELSHLIDIYVKKNSKDLKEKNKAKIIYTTIKETKYELKIYKFTDQDERIVPVLQESQAIFITFDLSNRKSFDRLYDYWLIWLRDFCKYEGLIIILGNFTAENENNLCANDDEIESIIKVSEVTAKYEKIGTKSDEEIVELFDGLMKEADEHDMRQEKNEDYHGDSIKNCIIW